MDSLEHEDTQPPVYASNHTKVLKFCAAPAMQFLIFPVFVSVYPWVLLMHICAVAIAVVCCFISMSAVAAAAYLCVLRLSSVFILCVLQLLLACICCCRMSVCCIV